MCDEMTNDAKTWRGEVHFITQAGEEAGAVVGTSGRKGGREERTPGSPKKKVEVAMINNNNNNNNNNNLGEKKGE